MEFDGFVALTGLDEMNIIYGMYAKAKNVSKVIAKIQHITFREVIENSGIESIISPKQITAERISAGGAEFLCAEQGGIFAHPCRR